MLRSYKAAEKTGHHMLINSLTLKNLKTAAKNAYPTEGCGLLIGHADRFLITDHICMENTDRPDMAGKHFVMDPLKVYEAEKEAEKKGLDILGFYHTHPDHKASLSEEDHRYMIPGMLYMILSVVNEKCRDIRVFEKRESSGIVTEILFLEVAA